MCIASQSPHLEAGWESGCSKERSDQCYMFVKCEFRNFTWVRILFSDPDIYHIL